MADVKSGTKKKVPLTKKTPAKEVERSEVKIDSPRGSVKGSPLKAGEGDGKKVAAKTEDPVKRVGSSKLPAKRQLGDAPKEIDLLAMQKTLSESKKSVKPSSPPPSPKATGGKGKPKSIFTEGRVGEKKDNAQTAQKGNLLEESKAKGDVTQVRKKLDLKQSPKLAEKTAPAEVQKKATTATENSNKGSSRVGFSPPEPKSPAQPTIKAKLPQPTGVDLQKMYSTEAAKNQNQATPRPKEVKESSLGRKVESQTSKVTQQNVRQNVIPPQVSQPRNNAGIESDGEWEDFSSDDDEYHHRRRQWGTISLIDDKSRIPQWEKDDDWVDLPCEDCKKRRGDYSSGYSYSSSEDDEVVNEDEIPPEVWKAVMHEFSPKDGQYVVMKAGENTDELNVYFVEDKDRKKQGQVLLGSQDKSQEADAEWHDMPPKEVMTVVKEPKTATQPVATRPKEANLQVGGGSSQTVAHKVSDAAKDGYVGGAKPKQKLNEPLNKGTAQKGREIVKEKPPQKVETKKVERETPPQKVDSKEVGREKVLKKKTEEPAGPRKEKLEGETSKTSNQTSSRREGINKTREEINKNLDLIKALEQEKEMILKKGLEKKKGSTGKLNVDEMFSEKDSTKSVRHLKGGEEVKKEEAENEKRVGKLAKGGVFKTLHEHQVKRQVRAMESILEVQAEAETAMASKKSVVRVPRVMPEAKKVYGEDEPNLPIYSHQWRRAEFLNFRSKRWAELVQKHPDWTQDQIKEAIKKEWLVSKDNPFNKNK